MSRRAIAVLAVAWLTASATGAAAEVGPGGNPIGTARVQDPGCAANEMPRGDDNSITLAAPFPLRFAGATYTSFFLNTNGILSFNQPVASWVGNHFPIKPTLGPLIAALWGDVDTRHVESSPVTYGATSFEGRPALCIDWAGVGSYGNAVNLDRTLAIASFQVLLIDRSDLAAGDFDVVMNYDRIDWLTGLAGGPPPQTGFDAGDEVHSLDGAASQTAMIRNLPVMSLGSDVPGRQIFTVRGGLPAVAPVEGDQVISFAPLADRPWNAPPFEVSSSATSGLAVSFSAAGSCTVAGTAVTLTSVGSCTITASQAGDESWPPASPIARSFAVTTADTSVVLTHPATGIVGNPLSVVASLAAGGAGVPGQAIVVTRTAPGGATAQLTTTTGANGQATVSFPAFTARGAHSMSAAFAGDASFAASTSPQSTIEVYQRTNILLGPASSGLVGQPITLVATLTTFPLPATAIAGQAVVFSFGGAVPQQTAITSANGVASVSAVFPNPGTFAVTASFFNPDAFFADESGAIVAEAATNTVTVKIPQTITFQPIAGQTYGASPVAGATVNSPLSVTYAVSGPCSIANGQVVINGAGSCSVTASQAGNPTYALAASVTRTFTVAKAPLLVRANNATRQYRQPNPSFSATYSGFVNGDDPSDLGGTLTFTTSATTPSPVGSYSVTPSGRTSNNYTISYQGGTLTVVKADTTLVANKATKGVLGVTMTAKLTRTLGGAPVAGQTVTFDTEGRRACSGTTDTSGVASCRVTRLPVVGARSYQATFAGDSNHNGSNATGVI